jgi:hypothetical protein
MLKKAVKYSKTFYSPFNPKLPITETAPKLQLLNNPIIILHQYVDYHVHPGVLKEQPHIGAQDMRPYTNFLAGSVQFTYSARPFPGLGGGRKRRAENGFEAQGGPGEKRSQRP